MPFTIATNVLLLASLLVWIWIGLCALGKQPFLPARSYEHVAWFGRDVLVWLILWLAGTMLLSGVVAGMLGIRFDADLSIRDTAWLQAASASGSLLTGILAMVALRSWRGAEWRQWGLGRSSIGGLREITIGAVGFTALLIPVFAVQVFVVNLLERKEVAHPALRAIQDGADPFALRLLAFAAVVAAPIGEEILFRGLLLGWLTKLQLHMRERRDGTDEQVIVAMIEDVAGPIDANAAVPVAELPIAELPVAELIDEPSSPIVPPASTNNPFVSPHAWPIAAEPVSPLPEIDPAKRRPAWLAIAASALAFAAIHFASWPDPIALVPFGLIVGYVYDRTRRLVPCIVMHALFNGFSVLAVLYGPKT